MTRAFRSLVRSASPSEYFELVQALGGDSQALLRKVGLSPRCCRKEPDEIRTARAFQLKL